MTELLSYVKKRWWVIFVISILCLILPYILRYYIHELPMAGEQSYDLARYVELHSDTERDPLLPSRSVTFTPYHYLLKGINYFFPFEFFQQWLPLIFGLITIVSMFFLMKQIQMDDTTLVCIAIIMIFAPVTVFTFFIPDYTGMVIALFSVALFLLNGKRYLSWIIGLLVLSFIPFFGIYEVVFCLGWLIVLFMYERKKPLLIGATLLIGGITLLLLWKGPIYLVNHSPVVGSFFKESISDFGGRIGISAFMYVLAILGFFYAWKQKKKLYPLYGMCIVWFVIAGHHPLVYMFFSLVGAYFASFLIRYLDKRIWSLPTLKNFTFLLLCCGLLFSYLTYVERIVEYGPSEGLVEALQWLEGYAKEEAIVFSHYTRGSWIAYYNNLPILLDASFTTIPDYKYRLNDSDTIFYSRNIDVTTALLQKYSVSYIVLDDPLEEQLYSSPNEGLLFLFRNNESFDKLYFRKGVLIYKYNNPVIFE